MKTSEDRTCVIFENGEEVVSPDASYEWINATDFENRSLGRTILIRGLRNCATDLEKFIELYKSVGIELEPVVSDKYDAEDYGYQYIHLSNMLSKVCGGSASDIYFDESGKFIQQGIWE